VIFSQYTYEILFIKISILSRELCKARDRCRHMWPRDSRPTRRDVLYDAYTTRVYSGVIIVCNAIAASKICVTF
jgi:hypothetical protein